ncbi:MAG: hypothetical protein V7607_6688 [Solirubrobacteraceae bacterium]
MSTTTPDQLQRVEPFAEHADQHRPLAAYGALALAFNGLVAAGVEVARRRRGLPERWSAPDLLLLGTATAKLSRLIAKDRVLAVARAPFTEFKDDTQRGEVEESARGTGVQRAIGELVICEYCLGQWVAAGFVLGAALAPRPTRAVAALFTVYAISDAVNIARSAADQNV